MSKLERLRRVLPDALGLLVAFVYGLPSVWYGFGRDQAIFYYIGREWLHGLVPYRDAFDVKPPGIYLANAIGILLFGPHTASIRILELLGVLASGWLIAAAVQRDRPRLPGEIGAAAMILASYHYSNYDYWNSGQVEFWQGLFTLASYVAVMRYPSRRWRAVALAGVLGGVAVMFKPTDGPACVVIAAVGAWLAWRRENDWEKRWENVRRAVTAFAVYGLASLAVVGIVVLYFLAVRAFPSLVELVKYQSAYSAAWAAPGLPFIKEQFKLIWWTQGGLWTCAFAGAWALGMIAAAVRRKPNVLAGGAFALVLTGLAFAAVALQRKYWWYHWGITAHFLVLMAAYGIAEIARWWPPLAPVPALALLAAGWIHSPKWLSNPGVTYRTYVTEHLIPYLQHKQDHVAFDRIFVYPQHFDYADQERVSLGVSARAQPGDMLQARAFEVGFNVLTGLRSPTRFVSESPIEEALGFDASAWQTEHNRVLWTTRPRFVVTFADRVGDQQVIRSHGYHELVRSGLYVGFERNP